MSAMNEKILMAIHDWMKKVDDGQPPTRLHLNPDHRKDFGSTYDFNGRAIQIDYTGDVPPGEVRCGRGR